MKRFEKILIILNILIFALQFVPNFYYKGIFFGISIWILAISYLIGSYWMLNTKENKVTFLSIIAGIGFALSLYAIPFIVRLNNNDYFIYLPILNGVFAIILLFYLLFKTKNERTPVIKNIFIRSIILFAFSSFFTYSSVFFKPYRTVLIGMNSGYETLKNNLLMFEYTEKLEEALLNNDCDKAIEYALKANESGKIWLEINDSTLENFEFIKKEISKSINDSNQVIETDINVKLEQFLQYEMLYPISRTYANLYRAYSCKANIEYDSQRKEEALYNYQLAHYYLTSCEHDSEYWKEEISWSLVNIARSYIGLKDYDTAFAIFINAIEHYKNLPHSEMNGVALFYSKFAEALSEDYSFDYSNELFHSSNLILLKDSNDANNRTYLTNNYVALAKNYLLQDSLSQAKQYLERAMLFVNKDEIQYCEANIYYGLLLYNMNEFQKADSTLQLCLECFEKYPNDNQQNIAECNLLLSKVNISLGKFDEARKYNNMSLEITESNFGNSSPRFANHLLIQAQLNKIESNYTLAEKQLSQIVDIYSKEYGEKHEKLSQVYAIIADLYIILSKFKSAKHYSDLSISIAKSTGIIARSANIELLNDAAYVHYNVGLYESAISYYQDVIKMDAKNGLDSSISTARALNGLGLVETNKKNYKKAHAYFQQSLAMFRNLFSHENPNIAIVYLNYAKLYTLEGKLAEAEEFIQKSLAVNKLFFKSEHDIFGDIHITLGDIAKKKGENSKAIEHYQKALSIFNKKFSEEHWKVIDAKNKLNE